jgi:dihydrofolate reductase
MNRSIASCPVSRASSLRASRITRCQALDTCRADDECFVIGGAGLFSETLPLADRLYLTVVDAQPAGDTFMPEFDMSQWRETSSESFVPDEKHAYPYRFTVYDRIQRQ